MLRVTLLGLRYRKGRLALSALAIVLGVAFVAGTLMMTASISRSYSGSFSAGARNVSVAVAERKSGDPPGQIGGQVLPAAALAAVNELLAPMTAQERIAWAVTDAGRGVLKGTAKIELRKDTLKPATRKTRRKA